MRMQTLEVIRGADHEPTGRERVRAEQGGGPELVFVVGPQPDMRPHSALHPSAGGVNGPGFMSVPGWRGGVEVWELDAAAVDEKLAIRMELPEVAPGVDRPALPESACPVLPLPDSLEAPSPARNLSCRQFTWEAAKEITPEYVKPSFYLCDRIRIRGTRRDSLLCRNGPPRHLRGQ